MIYLIETTYYNKETKKVLDLLKIGYTEDSRKDIRWREKIRWARNYRSKTRISRNI